MEEYSYFLLQTYNEFMSVRLSYLTLTHINYKGIIGIYLQHLVCSQIKWSHEKITQCRTPFKIEQEFGKQRKVGNELLLIPASWSQCRIYFTLIYHGYNKILHLSFLWKIPKNRQIWFLLKNIGKILYAVYIINILKEKYFIYLVGNIRL